MDTNIPVCCYFFLPPLPSSVWITSTQAERPLLYETWKNSFKIQKGLTDRQISADVQGLVLIHISHTYTRGHTLPLSLSLSHTQALSLSLSHSISHCLLIVFNGPAFFPLTSAQTVNQPDQRESTTLGPHAAAAFQFELSK